MTRRLLARSATAIGVAMMGAALSSCAAAQDGPVSSTTGAPSPTTDSPTAEDSAAEGDYRDGQYTATGWYGSLPSHQDVTLTIQGDTVSAVEITAPAEDDTSLGYQERFAQALPGAVIGRDIDDLQIDRLAGSSGCSEGFMNALAEIRDAARSDDQESTTP